MKCFSPMEAHRTADGGVSFTRKADHTSEFVLPCGSCIGCRLNHAESWAVRAIHEAQMHDENSFLTLTYSDEHLPQDESLRYEDVTKFIKKLRRVLDKTPYKKKLKYYRIGEYGSQLSRPHYHILLFGFDFSYGLKYKGIENIKYHWRSKGERKYYRSTFLDSLWDLGHAELGEVDFSTAMYTAKYVTKKVNGKKAPDHYNGKEPEKASMSKKNPIGKEWLEQFHSDIYPHDHVVHDSKKYRPPRFYDNWLEQNNPALFDQIKMERESNGFSENMIDLNREHEVKLRYVQNTKREFDDSAPITDHEWQVLEYHKKRNTEFLQGEKNAKKNLHNSRFKS